jgi:pSer/pThr/pTyr-binding forkhead associated (FHA) protein
MLIFRKKKDSGGPATSLSLTVVEAGPAAGVAEGDVFPLDAGDNLIGRDSACEVVIKGPTVSRRHASLRVSYGRSQVALSDLGSVNGTVVRPDTRLHGETRELQPGDEIQIGDVVLRLAAEGNEEEAHTMIGVHAPSAKSHQTIKR